MAFCKICFQETQQGITVPGHQSASGVVHEECLAAVVLRLSEDPQKQGQLRYLIEYEEKQAPDVWTKDTSGGSADVSWQWSEVGISAARIRLLLNAGLVSVIFSSNRTTCYSLVGREIIKEALGRRTEIPTTPIPALDIPADLFECIIGYEDIKDEIRFTLGEHKRNHYLLIGPPATAKSLFLMELGHLRGAFVAAGSRVSGAGLNEALFNYQPRLMLLDEIDKMPMDATAVLLSVMESGETLETKYKRQQRLKLDLNVLAAGNSDQNIPPELLSRFDTKLYFRAYSFEEFLSVCKGYLSRYENIPEDLAEYIGSVTWRQLDKDVRTARGIARRIREKTTGDVDRIAGFLRKYARQT